MYTSEKKVEFLYFFCLVECANSNLKLFFFILIAQLPDDFFQVQGRKMYFDIIECKDGFAEASGKSKNVSSSLTLNKQLFSFYILYNFWLCDSLTRSGPAHKTESLDRKQRPKSEGRHTGLALDRI